MYNNVPITTTNVRILFACQATRKTDKESYEVLTNSRYYKFKCLSNDALAGGK